MVLRGGFNLEPNTEYTASVFVKPLNTNSSYFGFGF